MITTTTNNRGREVGIYRCDRCHCDITEEWLRRPAHGNNEGGDWCLSCYASWYAPVAEWLAAKEMADEFALADVVMQELTLALQPDWPTLAEQVLGYKP